MPYSLSQVVVIIAFLVTFDGYLWDQRSEEFSELQYEDDLNGGNKNESVMPLLLPSVTSDVPYC